MHHLRTLRLQLFSSRTSPPSQFKHAPISLYSAYRFSPKRIPKLSNGFRRPFKTFPQLYESGGKNRDGPRPQAGSAPPVLKTIYTFPNLLTTSRIVSCPVLGYAILQGNFPLATSLLVYAGLTDLADGYLARKLKANSVLGTILDPAADKILMTTLVVTLTMKNMLPLPVGIIILSRDVVLSLWAFYVRYTSLPPPKTFQRYWDFSIPSAEVLPTTISKVNTALQLLLMGVTTISPLISVNISAPLQALQWTVAVTTLWSGFSYLFTKGGFKVLKPSLSSRKRSKRPPSST